MAESGRDCSEVLIRLSAVKGGIVNLDRLILEDHPEHCIPETAKEGEEEIAPLKGGNRQVIMSMGKTDKGTEKTKPIGVGILFAVLAAALYAINSPTSKLLLGYMPSTLMAGFLYIGAGIGMLPVALFRKCGTKTVETKLTRKELPYTVAMILLDIAAPICLLLGLKSATAANASLLNNFEIVATAVIALVVFREKISVRLWFGILFVTLSCVLLSFEDVSGLRFSIGSLLILVACVCWGLENNCTRKISSKDPLQIVLLKGIFSGTGSLVIGLLAGERVRVLWSVFAVLGVGFVAYGLSTFFYVYAQRILGAARTSAYYAIAPFIGTFLSLLIFREMPPYTYFIALGLMAVGAWLASGDKPLFRRHRPSTEETEKQSRE